jgi:hypothetical protein
MYAQYDIEGRQYNLMEGIVDQKTDGHIVEPADMYIKHGSNTKVSKTRAGTCVLNGNMGLQAGSAWCHADCRVYVEGRTTGQVGSAIRP